MHKEVAFEDAIERAMLDSGWQKGQATNYRRELGLDTAELFAFIGATQTDKWTSSSRSRAATLSLAPSIRTVYTVDENERPYADEVGPDGLLRYE